MYFAKFRRALWHLLNEGNQLPYYVTCGLYYKYMTIVNYASSIVNNLEALLTDNARVVIYNHHVFIVQATGGSMGLRYL